ncbi:hypothetical protein BDY21DRAFT_280578 [Lineolata rhizophorae]|uniref:Hemerythrin-like domain-containing protein n=1 Tax=Lineolata rhizophorae TaxID=578093 RepID=A0A6A6P9M8_9PEZI|nr:hypothetical protein BDY21DRAFT_280578 [Lineolata rhizophorae]
MTAPPSGAKPWADGPMPLVHTPVYETKKNDTFTTGATHMALVHNAILRGYNSIYHQAAHVQPKDYADFVGYCLSWFRFVKSHHDDEEEQLFPKVEEVLGDDGKGIWDETHKEHESFLGGLAEFHDYLAGLPSPAEFSGAKLLEIMAKFQDDFNHHFHSEISTIAKMAEVPRPDGAPNPAPIFARWGKKSIMGASVTDGVPFLFLNFDRSFEDGTWAAWPPMPAPIRWMLPRMGSSWHWGWWKFASCDVNGMPRELYAAEKQS